MAVAKAWALAGLGAVGWLLAFEAWAADCEPAKARLVSLQGTIELRRAESAQWSPALPDAVLCAGDALRVGERSRAALRLANESTLRLDENSTLTLAPSDEGSALMELLRGAINVMTRTPKPFKVRTPFLNAGVEGTEFLVRVVADATQVVVFEGKVSAANDQGAVELTSNETAIARRDAAPRRERIVRPADAVQWALYYPSIIGAAPAEEASLREADALARRGQIDEAFARLDAVPGEARTARHHAYRAELLLLVGRVDEARMQIARATELDANSSDARALQSIIAVVQNDEAGALRLAREAVQLDPRSVTAYLALSYAEQAHFDIPAALAAAERATEANPDSALAWSRAAELRMASGDLDKSLAAAQRASALDPQVARTQTVLGFAHLTRIETAAAREAFARAIELDQADYLPRLGLGLALIREGDLAAGREAIETATSLDPLNSLVRSYLGKAYYEEKRDTLAGSQFDLAKALDPNDPTPWLYDAIRKQSENRPVQALRELEKSIELNDNRAVYRSRLLLDEDRASRRVSLARTYRDLGFNELAVAEASKSLAIDPANASAHRFLSDAYADLPRQEIARASALLQSQLLQPVGLAYAQPSAPFIDVSRVVPPRLLEPGINEYSLLYERHRSRASIAALLGNDGTKGDEAVASILRDSVSLSLGQFHYQMDGFHRNGDIKHDIYNAFLQWAASDRLSLQAELRNRRTRHGDIAFEFDPADFLAESRVNIDQETARIGMAYKPSHGTRLIASFMDNHREERQHHVDAGIDIVLNGTSPGRQSEAQLQLLSHSSNYTFGLGTSRVKLDTHAHVTDFGGLLGGACAPPAPCDSMALGTVKQSNAYVYANFAGWRDVTATLGLARDEFDSEQLNVSVWNPKIGIRWSATDWLDLRAAAFKTLKRTLIVDQTIEPTQVAGFNQFYDDINGARTRVLAVATDLRLGSSTQGLLEASQRRLRLAPGLLGADLSAGPYEQWRERSYVAGIFWSPNERTAITAQYRRETFDRGALLVDDRPTRVITRTLPLTLRYFLSKRFSAQFGATHVRQRVARLDTSQKLSGEDSFVVIDAVLTYRLSGLNGSVGFGVNNALNQHFFYQDDNFRSSQTHLPQYLPKRNIVLTASLSF